MASTSSPRIVEEIFRDYCNRRASLVRALTYDVDEFFGFCDPEKENLCLYGHLNGSWEVTVPVEEVPTELPEPTLGINFARDSMTRRDWLSMVAVHSDCWLLSIAFYLGARLNHYGRRCLFTMINDMPTICEVVANRKPLKDKPSEAESKGSPMKSEEGEVKSIQKPETDEVSEDHEAEPVDAQCGCCGGNYSDDEFWIGCDTCERWYHGNCVKITPAKAQSMKHYQCPLCSRKSGKAPIDLY